MIDLRSDTKTKPTPEMRAAIAAAEVGDEQRREDPTVNELERRAAVLLGQGEAVFVPTATMANEIALRALGEPGDEVVAEENSHIFVSELGGPAVHAGLMTRPLRCPNGRFSAEQLRETVRLGDGTHAPATRIVSVENTHNQSGGRVWRLDELEAVTAVARELELRLHLDGARLLNAAVALGVDAAEIGRRFDVVTLCLSKGLGCPLGALVAGSPELMRKARRLKHLFGGAMRQAGIVAAAGVYALEHHIDRLADDHSRARRLAEGLNEAGVPIDLEQVETNFVQVDVAPLGLTVEEALERLAQQEVGLSMTMHPTRLRAVTHLDVDDDDIARAIELIPRALGALAHAGGAVLPPRRRGATGRPAAEPHGGRLPSGRGRVVAGDRARGCRGADGGDR
jgi:threonine aldolase